MGSTGTGRFTDYPGKTKSEGSDGTPQNDTGGVNQCERAIGNILVEDIARCPYYIRTSNVPTAGSSIHVSQALLGGRLSIVTDANEVIGLLPTRYNYLLQCMAQGYTYSGHILASSLQPLPMVTVDLAPTI